MTELNALKSNDPAKLIALYRAVTGKSEFCALPDGCTLDSIVVAIIEQELKHRAELDERR